MVPQVCITNRHLVEGDFLEQVRRVARLHPEKIVLREKDLSEPAYEQLAAKVLSICQEEGVSCVLHYYPAAAIHLQVPAIHLPLPVLRKLSECEKRRFTEIGVSTHSTEEAVEAQALGATYITAGHVFVTDCKKGLAPRGLAFLEKVCASVSIPVYAIGGIHDANQDACMRAGAAGVCRMSDFMRS